MTDEQNKHKAMGLCGQFFLPTLFGHNNNKRSESTENLTYLDFEKNLAVSLLIIFHKSVFQEEE